MPKCDMIWVMEMPFPFDRLPPNAFRRSQHDTGEIVFQAGAPTRGLWYVIEGAVKLVRYAPDGQEIILHRAQAGETIAEASLFAEYYLCDCFATEPSHMARIRKDLTMAQLESDPEFGSALMERLAHEVQAQRRMVALMSVRGAEDRVLAAMAEIGIDGTVLDFAARIGLTHEAVYRALAALVKQGKVIKTGRGSYALHYPE